MTGGQSSKKQQEKEYEFNQKLNEQLEEIRVLESRLEDKNKEIMQLERRAGEVKKQYSVMLDNEAEEKRQLNEKAEFSKKEYQELLEKYHKLVNEQVSNQNEKKKNDDKDKKKVLKVQQYQVADIGKEIKFNLIMNNISFDQIEDYLFTSKMRAVNYCTLKELPSILQAYPFSIKSEENAFLLARFLVESNLEDLLYLDLEENQEIPVVRSIFKKIVGQYKLLQGEEKHRVFEEVTTIIQKFSYALKDYLDGQVRLFNRLVKIFRNKDDKEFATVELINKGLKYIDANFNPEQNLYFFLQLYKNSNDINQIRIKSIFEIFSNKSE